jgi:uncharacterized repeat protein (TIGR03803 family)
MGELIEAQDGLFYGTTRDGGATGRGTIYKITGGGLLTTLHSFSEVSDGAFPEGPLVESPDGFLYGTASGGGPSGNGTIFRISLTGDFTTLFSFDGTAGSGPRSGLTLHQGLLYGSTTRGGEFGRGVIFTHDARRALHEDP